ncbi:MAG: ribulose-phosphate 3-epimerase [Sulfobacillus sp.]
MIRIHPSLLSADPLHIGQTLTQLSEADGLHLDIMDGHFVPPLTFGTWLAKAVVAATELPVEAHLMVSNPERHLEALAASGVRRLIIHQEATGHAHRLIEEIRRLGAAPAMAVNPGTPVETLRDLWSELDLVLVMSVDPGWGGQAFWPGATAKVAQLRQLGYHGEIEVDGGIDDRTAPGVVAAGATVLVSGSYILGTTKTPASRIAELREAAGRTPKGRP